MRPSSTYDTGTPAPPCPSPGLQALDLSTLKTMLDASIDSIMVIDEYGIIQAFNRAVMTGFGYEGHELLGRNVSMLMPDPHVSRHDTYLENYVHTGERKIIGIGREVTGRRKDGSIFPLHLSVGEFQSSGRRYFFGICHDITERVELNHRIVHMASHDALTGCLNRHQLVARINQAVATGQPFAVLFIDLNEFKAVNDNYGHRIGDRLLEMAAQRLRSALRKDDLLGRVGGDEFVACLTSIASADAALDTAQRMIRHLGEPLQIEDATVVPRASVGVSLFPEHGDNADDLINQADLAMYHVKTASREDDHEQAGVGHETAAAPAHVYIFDRTLRERSLRQHSLLARLRRAVADGALELHYQPQFDLRTLRPCGLEALLRWRDGEHGLVMPGDFLPLARRHGLMTSLSAWVLRQACQDNMQLIQAGVLDVPVAVNVGAQSINDRGFIPMVRRTLQEFGMAPDQLELEITEDMAVDFTARALHNATALVDMGVHLVMDDYGAGFSSLKQLKKLRFSKLKLDRSFIAALPDSLEDQSIVRTTLTMAHEMMIPLVAEGVETEEQLAYLREHGCEMGQGYWYARPMPLEHLVEQLRAPRSVPEPALTVS